MASNGLPWFRVYSEILDDKKIKRIIRSTGFSKAMVIGTWICFLALASESGERGRLTISDDMPYKLEDLTDETGLDHETLMIIIDHFIKMGMIVTGGVDQAYEITNWNRRQFKSDNSTERVREFRSKHDETLQKRFGNALDTESDTESDTDTESNTISESGDLFDDCQIVWETKTGYPVTDGSSFAIMIKTFKKEGVTAKIYAQAIEEMQKQKSYPLKRPTGAQEWAINLRKKLDELENRKVRSESVPAMSGNDAILEEIRNGKF
jgi:hypothetical protein